MKIKFLILLIVVSLFLFFKNNENNIKIIKYHNFALIEWQRLRLNRKIPFKDIILLHVDYHDDLLGFSKYIPFYKNNSNYIKEFTSVSSKISIASFISAGYILGLFNKFYFSTKKLYNEDEYINRKVYYDFGIANNSLIDIKNDDHFFMINRSYVKKNNKIFDINILSFENDYNLLKKEKNIVLDIDLDYFICSDYKNLSKRKIKKEIDNFYDKVRKLNIIYIDLAISPTFSNREYIEFSVNYLKRKFKDFKTKEIKTKSYTDILRSIDLEKNSLKKAYLYNNLAYLYKEKYNELVNLQNISIKKFFENYFKTIDLKIDKYRFIFSNNYLNSIEKDIDYKFSINVREQLLKELKDKFKDIYSFFYSD